MSEDHRWPYIQPVIDTALRWRDEPRLALLLRHSVRNSVQFKNTQQVFQEPISETGRMLAHRMGHNLCIGRPVWMFHSPVPRCEQSAEALAEGVIGNGCAAEVRGVRDHLGTSSIQHPRHLLRSPSDSGGLLRFWRRAPEKQINNDELDAFNAAGDRLLRGILDDLDSDNPNCAIQVNVSHDLTLATLLYRVLGDAFVKVRWPAYLEGMALLPTDDRIRLCFRDQEYEVPFPPAAEQIDEPDRLRQQRNGG